MIRSSTAGRACRRGERAVLGSAAFPIWYPTKPLPLWRRGRGDASRRVELANLPNSPASDPGAAEGPSGLEAVFLASRPQLLRFLASHGVGAQAEDLLQELWFRVVADLRQPVAQPLAYLYRATNNLVIDKARSDRQAAARDRAWSEIIGREDGERSNEPAIDRVLASREALRGAEAALNALGPRAATIFRRHRLDGVAQREIAREVGVSLSTVESDLRRAYGAMTAYRRSLDEA